jgi:hypothetical protein
VVVVVVGNDDLVDGASLLPQNARKQRPVRLHACYEDDSDSDDDAATTDP